MAPALPADSLEQASTRCSSISQVDPIVTSKTPGAGKDILETSANNLYVGVTMADLDGFDERYPLNSRLVKGDGGLVEEVYRVGGKYDTSDPRDRRSSRGGDPLRDRRRWLRRCGR